MISIFSPANVPRLATLRTRPAPRTGQKVQTQISSQLLSVRLVFRMGTDQGSNAGPLSLSFPSRCRSPGCLVAMHQGHTCPTGKPQDGPGSLTRTPPVLGESCNPGRVPSPPVRLCTLVGATAGVGANEGARSPKVS